MLSDEVGRYKISERVREGEAERLARRTRRAHAADERSLTRRVGRAAIALVAWPMRH